MDIQLAPDQQKQIEALARERGMTIELATRELLEGALRSALGQVGLRVTLKRRRPTGPMPADDPWA